MDFYYTSGSNWEKNLRQIIQEIIRGYTDSTTAKVSCRVFTDGGYMLIDTIIYNREDKIEKNDLVFMVSCN